MTKEELAQRTLFELEDPDLEGLEKADLAALQRVQDKFLGFTCRKRMAPQTSQWPEDLKETALAAVGGGDADSASMSDRLFDRRIPCVKRMNEALASVERIKQDRYYTLPHPEPGVRLVKKGKEELLRDKIEQAKLEIHAAAQEMNENREQIKEVMKKRLKGRYKTHANIYEVDFTKLYTVEFAFRNMHVDSYLAHNQQLYEQELVRAKREAAKVVLLEKQHMAEILFEVIDHLCERLEARQLLDRTHEVTEVHKKKGKYLVEYISEGSNTKSSVELSADDYKRRVTEDCRNKSFNTTTAQKIFDEITYAEYQLNETGIGAGELEGAFKKLKQLIRGQDRETFPEALRKSDAYREEVKNRLSKMGDHLLKLSTFKSRRDIVRGRAKSRSLNPEKV